MGRQGQETLTMDLNDSQSNSLRREKGVYLSKFAIFLLGVFFIASLIATGILVYYFSQHSDDGSSIEYNIDHHNSLRGSNIASNRKGGNSANSKDVKKKLLDVRLPRSVKPLHYYVRLIPYINSNFSISGHVEMTFEVKEPTSNITMHINDIVTKNNTIKITKNDIYSEGTMKIKRHIYDKERQFYIADLESKLTKGTYVISMDYEGHLNDDLDGFYRSSYEDERKNKRWLAATQFQPTDARKAFPCMDEPGLKASFTIEIGRQSNMSSISNMPLKETVPMEGQPGWYWDKFDTSVNMSTYLVAFIVSDFKFLESSEPSAYKFRVWARKSAISQADYAIKIGPPTSKYFEEFFNVSFPLPKQDMAALPDFSAGAMENWGLITYRETAMLYDPGSSRAADKQYLAAVIAHELAHQWFGNLVTPEWWTDLWLNEGFASYMEYIGANHVEPTWKMMEMFVTEDLQTVFRLDCLESSHPINIPVHHPDEINEIFDTISYLKGSSIIRMMSNFLTENTFRKGLSKYLKGEAYSSAVQDDLWRYLTNQGHEDGTLSKDVTVKTIMDTWTLQMGFPVITVTRKSMNEVMLRQERFLLIRNKTTTSKHDYKWWVPITYTTQSKPDFSKTNPDIWMSPAEETKMIRDIPLNGWIIFNNMETGYYRVNYDEENWQLIINQLNRDHTVISTINRAQIIDDSMALARAGLLSYKTAFKILSYLKNEKEYVPWRAALNALGFIQTMFSHQGGYGALKQFILTLILPLYNKLGFDDKVTDPHLEQLLREAILSKACYLDYKPCLEEAVKLFNVWKQNPSNYNFISPNLKKFVYCTAISEGSYEDWKFAWKQYKNSNIGTEKRIILSALGCGKEIWISNGYIYRSIVENKGIRKQDVRTVIGAVASTEVGRLIGWEFLKDKWLEIKNYFGSVSFTLAGIVKSTTYALNTQNQLKELKDFSMVNKGNFGSAERAVEQAIENTLNNLNWMNRNYEEILNWLTENGYDNII